MYAIICMLIETMSKWKALKDFGFLCEFYNCVISYMQCVRMYVDSCEGACNVESGYSRLLFASFCGPMS
jgi:hypothetical protein